MYRRLRRIFRRDGNVSPESGAAGDERGKRKKCECGERKKEKRESDKNTHRVVGLGSACVWCGYSGYHMRQLPQFPSCYFFPFTLFFLNYYYFCFFQICYRKYWQLLFTYLYIYSYIYSLFLVYFLNKVVCLTFFSFFGFKITFYLWLIMSCQLLIWKKNETTFKNMLF